MPDRSSKRVVFFFALLAISLATACSELPARHGSSSGSHAGLIGRTAWMQDLPLAMGEELCDEQSPFVRCYALSGDQCRQRVVESTVSCETAYQDQIPPQLRGSETGQWGTTIGECAK